MTRQPRIYSGLDCSGSWTNQDWLPHRLPNRHEYPARALRADRAVDHFAGVWGLELHAFVAAFVAIRMILIRGRPLGDFGRRRSPLWRRAEDRNTDTRGNPIAQ